jgi:SAM-dependent methyltransferase
VTGGLRERLLGWAKPRPDASLERRFPDLPAKQLAEIEFWSQVIDQYVDWYEGKIGSLFGRPSPAPEQKETRYGLRENAIWTWIQAAKVKYLEALRVEPGCFSGKDVLDVGCGPVPHLHCFENIRRFGLDQLVDEYRAIGFPLDRYDPPITYLKGSAESIPARENSMDAVISVNAIDHVDSFATAAAEIMRVLKPDGVLRMQVHYHPPTVCEPWSLDDQLVRSSFSGLELRKIHEEPHEDNPAETLVVWSTHD